MTYLDAKKILDDLDKMPYPQLRGVTKNIRYAKMIYDDYAGNMSELSAITQYIYEHINIENEDIKKIMLSVAVVEMKHLDLLGDLIKKLGLPPHYVDAQSNPWNSNNVNYSMENIKKIMEYNIYSERKAIRGI